MCVCEQLSTDSTPSSGGVGGGNLERNGGCWRGGGPLSIDTHTLYYLVFSTFNAYTYIYVHVLLIFGFVTEHTNALPMYTVLIFI